MYHQRIPQHDLDDLEDGRKSMDSHDLSFKALWSHKPAHKVLVLSCLVSLFLGMFIAACVIIPIVSNAPS